MILCISVENMRQSDAYTIANLVPGIELMHRAAWGVFNAVCWKGKIDIVVGSGNNGGDGYALACILQNHGYFCTVFPVTDKVSADSAYYAQKAKALGVPIIPFSDNCLASYDILVDCLLGTGFQGIVRGTYRSAITQINASDAYVVSVDINSGMNGDNGDAELAVRSDLTVTIGYVKSGLITESAGDYMKKLVCVDIGIVLVKEEFYICSAEEAMIPGAYRCPPWLDMNVIDAHVTE